MTTTIKVSLTSDFKNKATYLQKMYEIAQKAESGNMKITACGELSSLLGGAGASTWVQDRFVEAWNKEYEGDEAKHINAIREKYKSFKDMIGKAKGLFKPSITPSDVHNVKSVVDNIKRRVDDLDGEPSRDADDSVLRQYGKDTTRVGYGGSIRYTLGYFAGHELKKLVEALTKTLPSMADEVKKKKREVETAASSRHGGGEDIQSMLAPLFMEVETNLNNLMVEVASQTADTFDVQRTSEADYISYHNNSETFKKWAYDKGCMLTQEELDFFEKLSFRRIAQTILPPFLDLCGDVLQKVDTKIKSMSKDDQVKRDLQAISSAIVAFQNGVMSASSSGKKPDGLDQLINTLSKPLPQGILGETGVKSGHGAGNNTSVGAVGSLEGFMFRRINKSRVATYLKQLDAFKNAIADDKVVDRVSNAVRRMRERVTELSKNTKISGAPQGVTLASTESVPNAKTAALLGLLKTVRREVRSYIRHHASFVMNRHRDAQDYMNYWLALKELVSDQSTRGDLEEYDTTRRNMVKDAQSVMNDVASNVRDAFKSSNASDGIALLDEQVVEVEERYDAMIDWIQDQEGRIEHLHVKGAPPLLEALLEPQFLTIYLLKLLRLIIGWYGLRVASRVFQAMYDDKVYVHDEDPPLPIVFVGIFAGIDIAVNLVVLVILMFLRHMFKSSDNEFPVDRHMLSAWMLDYCVTMVLIVALASIIGEVIRKKKYFRYKYEGDRGIRAMQQMVMYVYCVILFMPFFRLAHG
jgi:hypothetical protein